MLFRSDMRTRAGLTALLVVFMLAGSTLAGTATSHSHEARAVGLYNADCSLALLATLSSSALVVRVLSAAPLASLVLVLAPFAVSHRLGASLRLADVRAPPVR